VWAGPSGLGAVRVHARARVPLPGAGGIHDGQRDSGAARAASAAGRSGLPVPRRAGGRARLRPALPAYAQHARPWRPVCVGSGGPRLRLVVAHRAWPRLVSALGQCSWVSW
jgi:hypothetical protein